MDEGLHAHDMKSEDEGNNSHTRPCSYAERNFLHCKIRLGLSR